ncbi:MAG: ABC transporter permease [bacterium]
MLFLTIIRTSLKSLLANKLRSFLAILGIIIGVGAVIAMLSLGAGARKDILDRISSLGTNMMSIRPGQRGMRGVMTGSFQNLTLDDALEILQKVPSVKCVSPVASGNAQLKYYRKNTRSRITGVAVTYQSTLNLEVEHGRFFNESEVDRITRVAVMGPETAQNLGITQNQIGEHIKIKGINFKLIGLLKAKGGGGPFNPDEVTIVPYTTAMKILLGVDFLDSISVQAVQGADQSKVQEDITQLLRKRHRIAEGAEDDFHVFNQAELIQTASEFSKTFTFLLGGIAAISLLVGGIGIMNIMLVTVTERTREIGIRKAIGAKDSDILKQFLIESLIMSGVGGLIGIAAGITASKLIGMGPQFKTLVEPASILLAFSFSVGVGVFFGYYPALRAARLDPIECLHYE